MADNEITRINFEPEPERRTPAGASEEQRSFLSVLASDANQVAVETAGAAAIYGATKLLGKIKGGGGDPPNAGQSGGQDAAPPQAD